MKTEIIEIEETKKFKPFKLEMTFETMEQAQKFLGIAANTVGFDYDVYDKLNRHIKSMNLL